MKVSITWLSRREGNVGFVLERYSDRTERGFGPMPANIVPAFIEARRKMFQLRMEQNGLSPVSSETSQ